MFCSGLLILSTYNFVEKTFQPFWILTLFRIVDHDIVLTTYEIVRREVGALSTETAGDPVKDDDEEEDETSNQVRLDSK